MWEEAFALLKPSPSEGVVQERLEKSDSIYLIFFPSGRSSRQSVESKRLLDCGWSSSATLPLFLHGLQFDWRLEKCTLIIQQSAYY
jgi:hypothetical protein